MKICREELRELHGLSSTSAVERITAATACQTPMNAVETLLDNNGQHRSKA
jgi:hypothetical protein